MSHFLIQNVEEDISGIQILKNVIFVPEEVIVTPSGLFHVLHVQKGTQLPKKEV